MNQYLKAYQALGFSVFPVGKGSKKPLVSWQRYQTERPSEETIAAWERQYPDCNVGIVTGAISGIVVIDIDGPEGQASLKVQGELPATPTVRTGKGRHYYFRHPELPVRNAVRLLPGIDFRGDGGYVVAPPSVHPEGSTYQWEVPVTHPIADLPAWLLSLLQTKSAPAQPRPASTAVEPAAVPPAIRRVVNEFFGELARAPKGERNDTLNRVAFQLGQYVGSDSLDRTWVEEQLSSLALHIGLERAETEATIASGLEAGIKEPKDAPKAKYTLLDEVPEVLDRPLRLIDDRALGVTWLPVGKTSEEPAKPEFARVVFDAQGEVFSGHEFDGSRSIEELGVAVELPDQPDLRKILSPVGFKRMRAGDWPDPVDVFERTSACIDAFVSFEGSFAKQRPMCDLAACWVIGSYMLDAFDVVGYLWPLGEKASGKTKFLNTVTSLAYLGMTTTAGSSFASIRDMANYGAMIGIDDCENVREMETSKRELLLAGNTRGTRISLKEPMANGGYRTRYVNNFAPRMFSSIDQPDATLGSRTIAIPLIATADKSKTRRSPARSEHWPHDIRTLIDDLWLLAVRYLHRVKECDTEAATLSKLEARAHDIWRVQLGIAYWLWRDFQRKDVFDRVTAASESYQEFNMDYSGPDILTLIILALHDILLDKKATSAIVATADVCRRVEELASVDETVNSEELNTSPANVGRRLSSLRFEQSKSHGQKRSWVIARSKVDQIAKARSVHLPEPDPLALPFDEVLAD